MDGETTPMLQTAARQLFLVMEVLNRLHEGASQAKPAARAARMWISHVAAHCQHPDHHHHQNQDQQQQEQQAAAGASAVHAVCRRDSPSGALVLAPAIDGRITIVGEAAGAVA